MAMTIEKANVIIVALKRMGVFDKMRLPQINIKIVVITIALGAG